MGPNTAFCLVIFGVLGIYCEFIWPGRVWQGVAGAAAAVTGAYFLWRLKPLAIGLELLALAAVLLILDAFVETCWIAGLTGTIAVVFGFGKLLPGAHGIHLALAVPWCIVFGIVTIALNWRSRRARRNKRADL